FELVNPSPSGTGTLSFLGTNSWTGSTYVDNGTLSIDASTTNGGMPSDVFIGNGSGAANSAVLTEGSAHNIADTAGVSLSSDGRWNLAGNETIGRLNGTGGTVSLGSSILTVNPTGVSSFAGVITGTGVFRKLGNYTQVLSGNNTYSGGTDITAGTVVVNGNQPAGAVTVQSGAYLFGSGTVGPLTVSGGASVTPGSSPPPSPNNGGPGILSVSGNMTLASGSTYLADLNGTTPGSGYDRIAVTGTASIAGANLQIYTGFTPTGGTTFTILTASAVNGTFAGLAEGTLVFGQNTGDKYYIHYSGTSVVLTACQNLSNVAVNLTSGSTTVCSGTGGTLSVSDTGGGGNSHQWGYRTVSNGAITTIPSQTNASYTIAAADFPAPGSYLVVCTSNPLCGSMMTSNEVSVSIGDPTAPTVTPPGDLTVTQTTCQ
ncbi:MAG TPA: autotransporter-associated beta strand repeat-containing protein, partial [Thermoanaerobaculia bacterium]|nr:autotransporter-associated beta strand repeat-containing protein [Thermoanaerobaculia bacterium]